PISTMSSFIEDGASDISVFASIPLSDAFRRLPANTHIHRLFHAHSPMPPRLCGRWRFGVPREVGLALFQEGRKRLFCVFRADLRTELFVLSLHRRLDLLTK